MSESGRVDGDLLTQDLTPAMLKTDYLTGIDLQVNGAPLPDEWYQRWITRAITTVEKEAQIAVKTHSFLREPHDYNAADYQNFCFIQLFNRPILRVDAVRAVYPTGTLLMDFPKEWIRTDTNSSQIQIVPTMGSLSTILLGRGGAWLPILFQTVNYLPQFFQVDYTAGFAAGQLPEDVAEAVMKRASIEILAIAGDLIYGPGISSTSTSFNGMSESKSIVNNGQLGAVFTSRIAQYRKDLYGEGSTYGGSGQPGLFQRLKSHYHGIGVVSL